MYSRVNVELTRHPKLLLRLVPVLIVFFGIFTTGIGSAVRQALGFVPGTDAGALSLRYIQQLIEDQWFRNAAWASLRTAFLASTISVFLGAPIAYLLWRLPARLRKWLLVYKVPIILPHITVAFIVMVIFARSGVLSSFLYRVGVIDSQRQFPSLIHSSSGFGVIAAYVFKETPFVVLMCLGVLPSVPVQMLQTAKMLGASRVRIFYKVVLPELYPIINTTFIILFLYSFGSFDVPYLLGGSSPGLLPVYIYNLYFHGSLSMRPLAMAALVLIFLFAIIFTFIYSRVASSLDDGARKI